ncbi:hypothetical protein D3C80_1483090 [compost metagenome]
MAHGDVPQLDIQRPQKSAGSKAIRQKPMRLIRQLECFVIATQIAHHTTMGGTNRRIQLGLLEGIILNLL